MTTISCNVQFLNDTDPFSCTSYLEPPRPLTYSFNIHIPLVEQLTTLQRVLRAPQKPDECALQLYRSYGVGGSQGDFGTYIDLDVSLSEQPEELELLKEGNGEFSHPLFNFLSNFQGCQVRPTEQQDFVNDLMYCKITSGSKRTSMVLRTQLSVRVHTIIEKLLNSTGRELRRALFSLKQIFQDDKDLVHEFVQNDGLACLIKVGAEADQNYQNYILRALGQVMLYVDGMNGVIAHNETIQWLYSLLTSKFRLVVKTALKLLLVFVEYTESNSLLLLAAVYIVDKDRGSMAWSNLMTALSERDTSDPELFIYAMTLLNKILNGIPDQDTFYDVVDACEEQGLEGEIRRMISMNNRELTEQCRQYENTLRLEDGDDSAESSVVVKRNVPRTIAGNERKSRRRTEQDSQQQRNSLNGTATPIERTRMSDQNRPTKVQEIFEKNNSYYDTANSPLISSREKMDDLSTSRNMPQDRTRVAMKKYSGSPETPGLPSAKKLTMEMLYRTKQPSQQQDDNDDSEAGGNGEFANGPGGHDDNNNNHPLSPFTNGHARVPMAPQFVQPKGGQVNAMAERIQRTSSSSASTPLSPTSGVSSMELKPAMGEESAGGANTFANALSRARKSMSSKIEATTGPQLCMTQISTTSNGKPEGDLQWEQAIEGVSGRPLVINDLDFTELDDSDDMDPFHLASAASMANSPLPGSSNGYSAGPPAPPPLGFYGGGVPPPPGRAPPPPSLAPPPLNFANGRLSPLNASPSGRGSCDYNGRAESPTGLARTDVKTLKLFWKEVKPMPLPPVIEKRGGTFWNQIAPVEIDTSKLCQLFEMKAKEIAPKAETKKEDKKLEILVLDTKRSNAINIALTKLPPPRAIKTAILKFDSSIMNKEGIEKVVTQLLPTEEEKEKIAEAQMLNPDVPLGSAENFLLTLASIPELRPRLRLWLFMVDYANLEREVAEPLMDLKRAMEELETCKTFQYVMATLLSIGNFLNGAEVRGFQLEYLAKVPEIKDTVHKHSMVHHLCSIVMEKFTDSTDLYSEFGAVARCAKVDFEEVAFNLERMEKDCKSSWDYLRALAKCESHAMKQKISEFLADCAQRILTLKVIHRRVMNRFHKFLLFMGLPLHVAKETKVNSICKIISEFSLEYRTTRERLLQQKRRTVEKRERNKTRGRTIIETKYGGSVATPNRTQSHEDEERHDELSRVLQSRPSACDGGENWSSSSGTLPGRMRHRNTPVLSNCGTFPRNGQMSASGVSGDPNAESPDDEILDGLVKAATVQTSRAPCERRKARQFNRKSLRRTRTLKLQDDQIVDA